MMKEGITEIIQVREDEGSEVEEPTLGLYSTISVFVGLIVGAGVFGSPGEMYTNIGSFWGMIGAWAISGVLSLFGAMCYAELGATYPRYGGEQMYCQKFYGTLPAFIFATSGWLTRPISTAALSQTVSEFLLAIIYGKDKADEMYWAAILATIGFHTFSAILSCFSTGSSKVVQDVLLIFKIAAVVVISCAGIYHLSINGWKLADEIKSIPHNDELDYVKNLNLGKLAKGLYLCLWSYDGWNSLNLVIPKVKNPARNFPLTLIWGITTITFFYSLVNVAFFAVLTTPQIARLNSFNSFSEAAFGKIFGKIIAGIVSVAAYGTLYSTIYCNAEAIIAGAKDRFVPKSLASINKRFGTPVNAHLYMNTIAIIVILLAKRRFSSLITIYSIVFWVFYALSSFAIYLSRARDRSAIRPYKAPIFAPAFFVFCSLFLIIFSFFESPYECIIVIVLFIILSILWFVFVRNSMRFVRIPGSFFPKLITVEGIYPPSSSRSRKRPLVQLDK